MSVLITGGNSHFARALATALTPEMNVRLLDTAFNASAPAGVETVTSDLREPDTTAAALTGVDTIIHLAPLTLADTTDDEVTALDFAARGSYVLMNAARTANVARIILGSTLDLFARLPAYWQVNETWRPRPEPVLAQLCPWLAELSVRESARVGTMQVICLRFGHIVTDADVASQPYDAQWLHIDDGIHGVRRALAYEAKRRPDWSIFHIMAPGPGAKIRLQYAESANEDFGYQPMHDFHQHAAPASSALRDERPWREILAPPHPIRSRSVCKVVIFGAGGPMGAVTTQEISSSYILRVTDIRHMADILADNKPQAPGAPLPIPLGSPHEERLVDVRNLPQVIDACEGMDAIMNTTVVRPHPVDAFLVNTIGAYNVMRAAVAHKIRRVVHTGPLVQHLTGTGDYQWDYDLPVDAPARPFDHLYIHSKYLGQEICRVFAGYYGLEVPVLLFCALYNPEVIKDGFAQFTISWGDTGRALRRALEVTTLPSPYEMMNISADLPHARFNHDKARTLLNWAPRDGMESFWQD